jgi:hypothetical protein
MAAYDGHYVGMIKFAQGKLFLYLRKLFPGIDEKWFIEAFMKSEVRAMLDMAVPKYVGMSNVEWARELFYELGPGDPKEGIFVECEYKKADEWDSLIACWCGYIYAYYQWKYDVKSKKLIEILPLSEMERIYEPLHQMGWDAATDKIHEEVL